MRRAQMRDGWFLASVPADELSLDRRHTRRSD